MTNISEYSDEQLAEAVMIEVLGWPEITNMGAIYSYSPDGSEKITYYSYVLASEGRAAIEDELGSRGWDWVQEAMTVKPDGRVLVCTVASGNMALGTCMHKSKYRAIAEAALMAVRGEG